MSETEILIVGGGFTGSALACALAGGGRTIHVLEPNASAGTRFAGELLHPHGVAELARLGLLAPLEAAGAVPIEGFAVVPRPGQPDTRLPYAAVAGAGTHGLGMEHHHMVAVMRAQAALRPGVSFAWGRRVTELLRERGRVVGVRTSDGEVWRADLVLCADGRHSKLRPARAETRLVSFTAALRVQAALPRPGFGHIFLGGWGPILAYPIGRDQVRLCFDLPTGIKRDQIADRLRSSYTHLLPPELRLPVEEALRSAPVDLVANHAMRVRAPVAPGVALVGDAGGCAHPLTAAGMTVCLNDVRLMAETLNGDGDLPGYARRRRPFVRSRAWLTHSLYRVFRGPDPVSRALRQGIFRYWRDPAARAASTALLTGADPSLRGFVRELWGVALSAVRA